MQLPQKQYTNRYLRLWGLLCIVLGLILAKWQIYDPLHAAEQHKQKVWILLYSVILGIYLPPAGLLLLVFGRRTAKWFQIDPQNLNLKNAVCLLLFAAVGGAAIVYVLASLESQGYHVTRGW
jgi:hypothetical protein